MHKTDRLMSVVEVANFLGIHASSVRRLIYAGDLNAYRVGARGGVLRVSSTALDEYLSLRQTQQE